LDVLVVGQTLGPVFFVGAGGYLIESVLYSWLGTAGDVSYRRFYSPRSTTS
jgi:hypothetical protein